MKEANTGEKPPNLRKSVLLLKVPYCSHPDSLSEIRNIRTEQPFSPVPSLGLAALSAFLKKYNKNNYSISTVDINIEAYSGPDVSIDPQQYIPLLEKVIKESEYGILALSAMFVFNVRWVDFTVQLSKKYHPDAKIILGGGYPTLFPKRCMEENDIDACVLGEGEPTLLHLINLFNGFSDPEFEARYPFNGYYLKDDSGSMIVSDRKTAFLDPDSLPIPDWESLNIEKYFLAAGSRSLPIEASRGCPYNCIYCCVHISWGRKVRYKPIDSIINELLTLKKKFNLTHLHFIDDNLTFNKPWIQEFLSHLIDLGSPIKFSVSNFSVKHLDSDIIDLLLRAGITDFTLAIESGSPEIQEAIRKKIDLDRAKGLVKEIQAKGAHVHLCWMVGFPYETLAQINSTFTLARKIHAESNQFLTVVPYPGTELFDLAEKGGLLAFSDNYLDRYDMRRSDYLKSEEWDYQLLQQMIYDVVIDLNFLTTPLLDSETGREKMISRMRGLLRTIPDHVVAWIVLGYLLKQRSQITESHQCYKKALDLLQNEYVSTVFRKYLKTDHPILNDFNVYLRTQIKT